MFSAVQKSTRLTSNSQMRFSICSMSTLVGDDDFCWDLLTDSIFNCRDFIFGFLILMFYLGEIAGEFPSSLAAFLSFFDMDFDDVSLPTD